MPDYTLYGYDSTAATAIHWILLELARSQGVTHEFVNVDIFNNKDQKRPEYLAVNPKGRIPVLVVDGEPISETGATAWLLAERHPDARLAPAPSDSKRARFVETFVFIVNSYLPSLRDWFYASRDGAEEHAHGIRLMTLPRLKNVYTLLDKQLATSKYLVSEEAPTIVDYIFSATTAWDGFLNELTSRYPNIKRHTDMMRATEGWKELCALEPGIESNFSVKDWAKPYLEL